jgi:hypothetical protein
MGIWSKILKIGSIPASFIPGAGPFIGAGMRTAGQVLGSREGAGLMGGVAGGLLAKKFTGPGDEANKMLKSVMELSDKAGEAATTYGGYAPEFLDKAKEGIDRSRFLTGEAAASAREVPGFLQRAEDQFGRAESTLQPSADYYTGVLKGGPAAMEAIAPEVAATRAGYEQARTNISQFGPRGGGRSATLMELPFRQQGDITNLLATARREAAGALPEVAQVMTQMGMGRASLAEIQIGLADVQRRIGATEKDIFIAAGQLGISAGQLQALLLSVSQRGAEAILNFDIQNRQLVYQMVKDGAKAGGDIAKLLWDVIGRLGGGGLFTGGAGNPSGEATINFPGFGGSGSLEDIWDRESP